MALSELAFGGDHPSTNNQPKKRIETEIREVAPGQFGHVATRDTIMVPQRPVQLSEIAHGPGDETEKRFSVSEPTSPHDFNPDK